MSVCLLVNDMQVEFMKDKKKQDITKKVGIMSKIISDFRNNDIPIFFSKFKKYGNIISKLDVKNDEVLFKNCSDGFYDVDLDSYDSLFTKTLESYKKLYVIGCNSNICVKLTVDSALKLNHKVILFKNALLASHSLEKETFKTLIPYYFKKNISVRNYKGYLS